MTLQMTPQSGGDLFEAPRTISSKARDKTLLIYAPVPLFHDGQSMLIEEQASNGIRLWADNFDSLIVMMPLATSRPRGSWIPVDQAGFPQDRVRIEALPSAYRPDVFLRALPGSIRKIRFLIREADYLSFAIGGLFGDWGAVSAIVAQRLGRPFAVWTDRVESEVVRSTAHRGPLKSRVRARLTHRPMAWLERFIIQRAALGLFHGRETFDAYASFCRNSHIVHDIHLKKSDHLEEHAITNKMVACRQGPLKLGYAGRADEMKGPLDWIAALEGLARQGIDFRAVWLGDGDLHRSLVNRIELLGLGDRVSAPGYVSDRSLVLQMMREAHALLFCHITPESPRCLIEALISGCPLVGYSSSFALDLTACHGARLLSPVGDTGALVANLSLLARDREMLARLIECAAFDGAPFDDASVFSHRSELIKAHLKPRRA